MEKPVKLFKLYLKQTRPLVAIVAIIFMTIGAAKHGEIHYFRRAFLAATLAILSSYALAASLNDIQDHEIDAVNLAHDRSRPLVTGMAHKSDLYWVASIASTVSVLLGFSVNMLAGAAMLAIVCLDTAYSVKPFIISRRTYVAPLMLPLVYVVFPYILGVAVEGSHVSLSDLLFIAGCYLLFLGRIILKDFRDRAGDRKFGKLTFLLRHGKVSVLISSAGAITLGGLATLVTLRAPAAITAILVTFLLAVLWALYRISRARDLFNELVGIGLLAKAGNAYLLSMLSLLILRSSDSNISQVYTAVVLIGVLLGANIILYLKYPKLARLDAPTPPKLLRAH
ncbi:MAG TPA: UbiA family prenyltransferase [Candidatus Saccharimonadia bacterium]|nr:UbiA family prenyltransferase [Candidatus Saccharimonadia bacterium]